MMEILIGIYLFPKDGGVKVIKQTKKENIT
jgi:hypothetical protein